MGVPISPVVRGLLNGAQLGMQLRRAALEQQAIERQRIREDEEAQVRDIQVRQMLQGSGRLVVGGAVELPGTGPRTADEILSGMNPLGGLPGIVRKSDKSRTVKYKTRSGDTIETELFTPEEQTRRAEDTRLRQKQQDFDYQRALEQMKYDVGHQGDLPISAEGLIGQMIPELVGRRVSPSAIPALANSADRLKPQPDEIGSWDRTVSPTGQVFNTPRYKSGKIGDPQLLQGVTAAQPGRKASGGGAGSGSSANDDVKAIADAIERGDQPPVLTGLYRNTVGVRAELGRRKFPLAFVIPQPRRLTW